MAIQRLLLVLLESMKIQYNFSISIYKDSLGLEPFRNAKLLGVFVGRLVDRIVPSGIGSW